MDDFNPAPKEIGAIICAYTGILCGNFSDIHEYVEKLMGRPVFTHEMGNEEFAEKIKELSKPDFMKLAIWCGGDPKLAK